jgi:hypothetical protein
MLCIVFAGCCDPAKIQGQLMCILLCFAIKEGGQGKQRRINRFGSGYLRDLWWVHASRGLCGFLGVERFRYGDIRGI